MWHAYTDGYWDIGAGFASMVSGCFSLCLLGRRWHILDTRRDLVYFWLMGLLDRSYSGHFGGLRDSFHSRDLRVQCLLVSVRPRSVLLDVDATFFEVRVLLPCGSADGSWSGLG
jgi:hypothetical protein